jgi:tripartite-type tricarboxylate transporter receptor subunit TctC
MTFHKSMQVSGQMVLAAACLLTVISETKPCLAQAWPNKTITVVVPLGGGSGTDVMARIVMEQVSKQLGRAVIVENRPGAGGTIGANSVAKAPPDGYTILAWGAMAVAHALYSKIPYDTLRDFVPVVPLGQQPLVLVTSPAKGYKTLGELVGAARANPGKLNYSSAGIGSVSHFAAERLLASTGIRVQNIPFKGAAEAVTDVVAGRSDFSIEPITSAISLIGDGQLVALAVSTRSRATLLPDVPTTIEAGLPADSVYPFWSGLFVPANTPRNVIDIIYRETSKAVATPAIHAQLAKLGGEPMPMTQSQFGKFFKDDVEANVALVKAANIPRQ